MQPKKSQYSVYSLMLDGELKLARQLLGKTVSKGATERDIFEILNLKIPGYHQSLNFLIFCEEHFWRRTGGHTIFPETKDVLDNLLRARFQMDSSEGFSLPFESFMFTIPAGFTTDGIQLPSFLVTWIPYQEMGSLVVEPFGRYIRMKDGAHVHLDIPRGSHSISICYRDPTNPSAYARVVIGDEQIPELLAVQDIHQFRTMLGHYGDGIGGVKDVDELDLRLQQTMLKLVAALGIYDMATEGNRIKPGFPGGQQPKMMGKMPENEMRFLTLKNATPKASSEDSRGKDAYYRTWHFRQLRDERYYKGEFEQYPRGSRYVFVSDTVVGQKLTAQTLK